MVLAMVLVLFMSFSFSHSNPPASVLFDVYRLTTIQTRLPKTLLYIARRRGRQLPEEEYSPKGYLSTTSREG